MIAGRSSLPHGIMMYTLQVKDPNESADPWDLYTVVASVSGDQAARPLRDGGCPFLDQMAVK
jgi:branched-chain amino acid transport system substrate-binding protein